MARARSNGIELEYETFGSRQRPAILLVMGWGAQMIGWSEEFCALLAGRGFYVIRFDNRDVGLSTKLDHLPTPNRLTVLLGRSRPPYTLDDMADDAAGLLDALGIEKAHVVGASMGGHIAQLLAIDHADRVLSLTSIMSGLGGRDTRRAELPVLLRLATPPPGDRERLVEWSVELSRMLSGPRYFDERRTRAYRRRAIARSWSPAGRQRQLAAIMAAPSRRRELGRLTIPTLVLHGDADPLSPVVNGRWTAQAIPGAKLLILPGMGHDLPPEVWPEVVDAIVENASGAERTVVGRRRGT